MADHDYVRGSWIGLWRPLAIWRNGIWRTSD